MSPPYDRVSTFDRVVIRTAQELIAGIATDADFAVLKTYNRYVTAIAVFAADSEWMLGFCFFAHIVPLSDTSVAETRETISPRFSHVMLPLNLSSFIAAHRRSERLHGIEDHFIVLIPFHAS